MEVRYNWFKNSDHPEIVMPDDTPYALYEGLS